MMLLSVLDIVEDTTVDGPGFRTAIYGAGCANRCPGCHNPESWDIKNGKLTSVEVLLDKVLANEFANVTFSGGDPFYQAEAFTILARSIKEKSRKTIWCYTGLLYEQILKDPVKSELLAYVDVLVDGRYEQALRSNSLLFRGSSNQRLIDVQKSLEKGEVVLFAYNPFPILELPQKHPVVY